MTLLPRKTTKQGFTRYYCPKCKNIELNTIFEPFGSRCKKCGLTFKQAANHVDMHCVNNNNMGASI